MFRLGLFVASTGDKRFSYMLYIYEHIYEHIYIYVPFFTSRVRRSAICIQLFDKFVQKGFNVRRFFETTGLGFYYELNR